MEKKLIKPAKLASLSRSQVREN
ncbi:hypothetical protein HKBW3S03_02149, partial [Candidatus Hakubella thermalkaliphila]